MKETLYTVLVEREYFHSARVDIKANSEIEARRLALKALDKNEIELKNISIIPYTDKVIDIDSTIRTRCQSCDSPVVIPYQPNSKVKCPSCKAESDTSDKGEFIWNWRS